MNFFPLYKAFTGRPALGDS